MDIGQLKRLERLSLSGNRLRGLPASVGGLESLQVRTGRVGGASGCDSLLAVQGVEDNLVKSGQLGQNMRTVCACGTSTAMCMPGQRFGPSQ